MYNKISQYTGPYTHHIHTPYADNICNPLSKYFTHKGDGDETTLVVPAVHNPTSSHIEIW